VATIRVQPYIDEPIAVFLVEGHDLNSDILQTLEAEITLLLDKLGSFYAILDFRGLDVDGGEIITLLHKDSPSTIVTNPRISLVIVSRLMSADQASSLNIPVFFDQDEALQFVREQLAQQHGRSIDGTT
jgi:hypothetical protein